jgi:hypothetical protein
MTRRATQILLCLGVLMVALLVTVGCADKTSHSRGVYMLLDTSGTYTKELDRAQAIVNFLLGSLQPGDALVISRIDSGSFSEKDIICKMTFDGRPSVANQQKRLFREKVDTFVESVVGSPYTDITGGIVQAVEYLNESQVKYKHILIFSDLKEELAKGQIRDFPLEMDGCQVAALNVTKLRTDNIDPRDYFNRVGDWEQRVVDGGGHWKVINDLDNLETLLTD